MSRSFIAVLALILLAVGAVAVPSLRRALDTPGVQGGLGELRSFQSAEISYANENGGYFDEPSCLGAPSGCIPRYRAAGTPFLDPGLATLRPSMGYAFRFHAGPRPQLSDRERAKVSKSSIVSYALVAEPVPRRNLRAFCGDASGRLCVRKDGTMPDVKDGQCPQDCETLR